MKWMGKRSGIVLAIVILFVLGLTGCDTLAGIFDPLIGKWQWSVTGGGITQTITFTFHSDQTWEGVMTLTGSTDSTVSGTYTKDSGAETIAMTATSGGTGTETYSYSFSSDKKTMYLTPEGVPAAIIFSRI